MRNLCLICLFLCLSISAYSFNWSGEAVPCPGREYKYSFDLGRVNQPGTNVTVSLSNGRFTSGESSKTFSVKAANPTLSVNVIWNNSKSVGIQVAFDNMSFACPINIRNLENVPFPLGTNPAVTGTGTLISYYPSYNNNYPGSTIAKHVGVINIPYGAEGSTSIRVPAISYFGNAQTSEYRWKINGVEIASKGAVYTLSHTKTNNTGTKLVVTARNSCDPTYLDSNPIEFTVTRNGLYGKDVENINKYNITSNATVVAMKTINFIGSQVSNNAIVEMTAGENIIITPNSIIHEGTKVILGIKTATVRAAELRNAAEEADVLDSSCDCDGALQDNLAAEETKLYPNPTTGLINVSGFGDISKVEVYSVSGQLADVITDVYDSFDIAHLSDGVYVIRVYTKDDVQTYRVILKK